MRPPAVEKMGYYPTSIQVINALKTWIAPANDGRLLDPCCGEGSAAVALARAMSCTNWGVELSPARSQVAERQMDRVLCAAWQTCTLTNAGVLPHAYRLAVQARERLHERLDVLGVSVNRDDQ